MFRSVTLPEPTSGKLFLHSMPGRWEAWEEFAAEVQRLGIDTVVCLTPEDEIEKESPEYARAIKSGALPFQRESFPLPDHGVPEEREKYTELVTRIAGLVSSGRKVLVHCGAGIGRTGTFAICLPLALGFNLSEAQREVRNAGFFPDNERQEELTLWWAKELRRPL